MKRLSWIVQVGSKTNDLCVFIRDTQRRDTEKRRKQCDTVADIGLMLIHTKESLKPPEARRDKDLRHPKSLEGAQLCNTLI